MTMMTIPHQAAAAAGWALAAGAVRSLPAVATPRLLLVLCGRVWITECIADGAGRVAVDHWLDAGQTLALPAGSHWIVESALAARLLLLLPPPVRLPAAASAFEWRPWRAWRVRIARLAGPAAPRAA